MDKIHTDKILECMKRLRLCKYKVEDLIDFRTQCLSGVNEKLRHSLTLTQILQLYIACFQHSSIWEEVWTNIIPVMNHTIKTSCEQFRNTHEFDLHAVGKNLVESLFLD